MSAWLPHHIAGAVSRGGKEFSRNTTSVLDHTWVLGPQLLTLFADVGMRTAIRDIFQEASLHISQPVEHSEGSCMLEKFFLLVHNKMQVVEN